MPEIVIPPLHSAENVPAIDVDVWLDTVQMKLPHEDGVGMVASCEAQVPTSGVEAAVLVVVPVPVVVVVELGDNGVLVC